MPREPEAILALRLGGIGEILAVTPALRAVRERWPRARIALLAERGPGQAAAPWVDEIVAADAPYRARDGRSLLRPAFWCDSFALAERLFRTRWDLLLDFHHRFARRHALKPFLVAALSRARRRIGFGPGFFLTDPVDDPDDRPMVERSRSLVAPLGIDLPDPKPEVRIAAADREWVDALLEAAGLSGKRLILIAPGSSRPATRWPAAKFREAAVRLSRIGPLIAVGSHDERDLCGEALPPGGVNLAGRTTLGRLAALLARGAVLVANDSGPMHLAVAAGTPTVGIFRPGERIRWGGYRSRFRALWKDGPGAEEGRTLDLVGADEVAAAAEDLLGADPARP
jgi:ADP-heptose:LPS heptosyltransferase